MESSNEQNNPLLSAIEHRDIEKVKEVKKVESLEKAVKKTVVKNEVITAKKSSDDEWESF